MLASKREWRATTMAGILVAMLTTLLASAQTPPGAEDPKQALIRFFNEARDAFAREDWGGASERFRQVSVNCPGSPLALESNYFATLALWKREDSEAQASMLAWLREAKLLQDRLQQAQKPVPSSWDGWVANMQLLLAQSERHRHEWESAEQRLRGLLEPSETNRSPDCAWPKLASSNANAWFELGRLTQDRDRNLEQSLLYFQKAFETSPKDSELRCSALAAIAKLQIQLCRWDSSSQSIAALEECATGDPWRVKIALLRSEIARAKQDAPGFAEALQPAVPLVLAGCTDLQLAYELTIALLEARDDENAEAVLLQIVQRNTTDPISIEAKIRLATRSIEREDWKSAKAYLDQAIEGGCSPAWLPHARFSRGRVLRVLGQPDEAIEDFEAALQCDEKNSDLEVAIRFELAETLCQRQRWDDAQVHWQFLSQPFPESKPDLPAWLARVWLRQGEMQALKQNWKEAEEIVSRIQSQFPECDCRDDVDYLRARCLISKARFEEARQLLDRIAKEPISHSPDLAARTRWMMGETFLMQRRYGEALQAYEAVLETGSSPYWQSAAWMQIGQCRELMRDPLGARIAYQTVMDRYAEGPFGVVAQQKLNSLEPSRAPGAPSVRTSNDNPVVNQR